MFKKIIVKCMFLAEVSDLIRYERSVYSRKPIRTHGFHAHVSTSLVPSSAGIT